MTAPTSLGTICNTPGDGDYYLLPKARNGAVALEPFSYDVGGQSMLMITYGVPILVDGKFVGTGGVNLALKALGERMGAIHPFETGYVEIVSASGLVVSGPDAALVGKVPPADDPALTLAMAALKGGATEADGVAADGTPMRFAAVPIHMGGAEDRWRVITAVPIAALEAPLVEARTTIIALAVGCVLLAGLILFALITRMVGRSLRRMIQAVDRISGGDYAATVDGTARPDEIGTLARALETFKENGLKIRQMTEDERLGAEERHAARQKALAKLEESFGRVVDAAVAGDLSVRIESAFDDSVTNNIAASVSHHPGRSANRALRGCRLLTTEGRSGWAGHRRSFRAGSPSGARRAEAGPTNAKGPPGRDATWAARGPIWSPAMRLFGGLHGDPWRRSGYPTDLVGYKPRGRAP